MSGAAPVKAKVVPIKPLSVSEARGMLDHPVFGDERHIEARDFLSLAGQVARARQYFRERKIYIRPDLPPIAARTAEQLQDELNIWVWAGWEEEEYDT